MTKARAMIEEALPHQLSLSDVIDPPNKIKAENIPTEQEIYAMRNSRDKALIMVMKESGWRVGERLQTQIKNVSHTERNRTKRCEPQDG